MRANKVSEAIREAPRATPMARRGDLSRLLRPKVYVAAAAWAICGIIIFLLFFQQASADDKQWTGTDDALNWDNDANWFSAGVPSAPDNAVIDVKNSTVIISEDFNAKSLTVGGRTDSSLTVPNFVYGVIVPAEHTDNALCLRKGGTVILQGAGIITLKGAFKNSEQTLFDEPAFMFEAE